MDHQFCPGAKLLRQPKPEVLTCSHCGEELEMWSDEIRVTCPSCKKTTIRDGTMSCLEWCKMGEQCVGKEIYGSYMRNRAVVQTRPLVSEAGSPGYRP